MFKDSRIYIAGHRGLLGSSLFRRLEAEGHKNIIARGHDELDLTDQAAVNDFFKSQRPEYVFLAAGMTGGIAANSARPAAFLHENMAVQDNVFEAARSSGVKNLVFYGSSCVYPKDSRQPIKEERMLSGPLEETSAAYAAAKIAGIMACRSYNKEMGRSCFIALVPNTIYGPGDNFDAESSHVLPALIRKIGEAAAKRKDKVTLWGSGLPKREIIFSDDVAEASIFAVRNAGRLAPDRHYNIGSGEEYSIKDLAKIISALAGFDGRIEWDKAMPDGAPRKLLDSSKFLALGWKPKTSLEAGLKETYGWYLKEAPVC